MKRRFAAVVITGASSGLGAALARRYARDGATLGLIGRDPGRLDDVAAACRAAGAGQVMTAAIDVRDAGALKTWIKAFDAASPIDLMIANAGRTGGWSPDGAPERPEDSRALIEINVLGALTAVQAVLDPMIERGAGQIALTSSLAALVPLRGLPSYCASKAALLSYALALRETVRDTGVGVCALCPGYVDTPLLRQLSGPRPIRIAPDDAAEIIHRGLAANRRIIAFPRRYAAISRLLALLPAAVARAVIPLQAVKPTQVR